MALFQPGRDRRLKLCWLPNLVLAAYVSAVATLPLMHHDVICHVQSSSHCPTCLVTAVDKAPDHSATMAARLVPLGWCRSEPPGASLRVVAGDLSGRSPPVVAHV